MCNPFLFETAYWDCMFNSFFFLFFTFRSNMTFFLNITFFFCICIFLLTSLKCLHYYAIKPACLCALLCWLLDTLWSGWGDQQPVTADWETEGTDAGAGGAHCSVTAGLWECPEWNGTHPAGNVFTVAFQNLKLMWFCSSSASQRSFVLAASSDYHCYLCSVEKEKNEVEKEKNELFKQKCLHKVLGGEGGRVHSYIVSVERNVALIRSNQNLMTIHECLDGWQPFCGI